MVCFILGSRDLIAERVLKFLYDPDEKQIVESLEEEEEFFDEDKEKHDDEPEKKKNDRSERGSKIVGGRPRRSTVGKSIVKVYVNLNCAIYYLFI